MNKKVDVLVVGGGSAGLAAAVSAARQGAEVILLERNSYLGGKATSAVVGTICGLYFRSEDPVSRYLASGFIQEFTERLRKLTHTQPIFHKEGLHFLPYDPFSFKLICDELIIENNIDIHLHATCIDVRATEGKINQVEVIVNNRRLVFEPLKVIDCSGESVVSRILKTAMISSEDYQSSAQVFSMENVEEENEERLSLSLIRTLVKAIEAGDLGYTMERISIIPGSLRKGVLYLKLSIQQKIAETPNEITEIEIFARRVVHMISTYLINNHVAFRQAHIGFVAPEVGIRTGSRQVGKYVLTEEDVSTCRKFEDGIANGGWPIEDWRLDKKPLMRYFAMDDYYQIPKNCLISKDISNLYFGGRNISATDRAIASARVIGTCLQTGWAAGELAVKMG